MFPSVALLSLISVTLSIVDASPLTRRSGKTSLGFLTQINKGGTLNIVEQDRTRAQAFGQSTQFGKPSDPFDIANAGLFYTADVGVGSPPSSYRLVIDTGSSNTWVGASPSNPYVKTSTSQDTGNTVSVLYGSGSFSGEEWIDQVTLSPDLVISHQSIGVANRSTGFHNVDGILGVGPLDRTEGTVSNTTTVPTVLDNLLSQGTISEKVLGVYFIPGSEWISNGELTLGGYDDRVIIGSVNYVSLTTASPSSQFWGIDQSITYGVETILSSTAGIVDTGTTLILIATNAFEKYQSATGATLESTTGLLTITPRQYANLKPLRFKIGDESYDLTPNAQIWPRSLNHVLGGSSHLIYLVVNDLGDISQSGLNFVNGYTFLERYYSVFDTTNNRVGFASTVYTESESN